MGEAKNYPRGIPKPSTSGFRPAMRKCLGLGCERVFNSLGPSNRICPKCREKQNQVSRRGSESTKDYRGE